MRRLLSLFLIFILFLTSCQPAIDTQNDNAEFSDFTNQIFCTEAASDSLSLNYTLTNPEKAGISSVPNGLSSFSYEDLKKSGIENENLLASLQNYDVSTLSFQQKLLYDTLADTLEREIQGEQYTAFTEALGPTTGIQAQLPVLLAEFRLTSKQELSQYFAILKTLPAYFNSLLALETKKAKYNTLPCRSTLQNITAQVQSFLKDPSCPLLTTTFSKKITACDFLNPEEIKQAVSQNEQYIKNYVIPAYQSLNDGLSRLQTSAGENGALCSYPNGKSYYAYLVTSTTGSPHSLTELTKQMQTQLDSSQTTLLTYAAEQPSLFSSCQRYTTKYTKATQILDVLKEKIKSDFPSCENTNYTVKSVDTSLEQYLSPAFYLTPPVDDCDSNVIYINHSDQYDVTSLFNTLAHEGYPGHLFQACYLRSKELPMLRYVLDYEGYTEGWATYAEIYSYPYSGITTDEAAILQNNMISTLCLYGLCDIGIHNSGWNVNQVHQFLSRYGSTEMSAATSVYSAIIDEPASYLKYTVGYLEILRIQAEMKQYLGEKYTDKIFHTFLLDIGPTSFSVIEKYIPLWCTQNGCN